jgi:hypothetical protein
MADINLSREVGVSTGRGEAFGITSSLIGVSKGQGLMIWYEYVD